MRLTHGGTDQSIAGTVVRRDVSSGFAMAALVCTTIAASGLVTANAGATVASGQTLTVTGATVTGLTAASVGAGTFPGGTYSFTGATTLTGGAGNMTIVAGTGISRTMVLQATSSGSVATTNVTLSDTTAVFNSIALSGITTLTATGAVTTGALTATAVRITNSSTFGGASIGAVHQFYTAVISTVDFAIASAAAWRWLDTTQNNVNMSLTDAGALTVRGGVTVSAGGLRVTAGNVGIGIAPLADRALGIQVTGLTGISQYQIVADSIFSSGATTQGVGLYAQIQTAAAAFTMASGLGVDIQTPVIGAGSVITTVYGLRVRPQTGGGTNYAIFTESGLVRLGDAVTIVAGGLTVSAGTTAVQALTATTITGNGLLTVTVSAGENVDLAKTSGPAIQFRKTAATAQTWQLAGEGGAFKLYDTTRAAAIPFQVSTTGAATFENAVSMGALTATGATLTSAGLVIDITTAWPLTIRDNTVSATGEFRLDLVATDLVFYLDTLGLQTPRMLLQTTTLRPNSSGLLTLGTAAIPWGATFVGALTATTGTFTGLIQTTVTTEQARLRFDATNYLSITVSSAGLITYDAVGTGAKHKFLDTVELPGGATLLAVTAALTDGAGASTGTLTNAPAATNPTKWISIDDAGVTRKIPAW